MPAETTDTSISLDGWTFRLRAPEGEARRVLVLVHGWTGNENVMWIFVQRFPPGYWMLAPRGMVTLTEGSYGWHQPTQATAVEDLRAPAEGLLARVEAFARQHGLDASAFDWMGFSQGAALIYAIAALQPERIRAAACLAGFLPRHWQGGPGLRGKPFFVAHGTRDDVVPVDKAREAVSALQAAGAQVTYCEAETTHKLSAGCFKGLEQFFEQ